MGDHNKHHCYKHNHTMEVSEEAQGSTPEGLQSGCILPVPEGGTRNRYSIPSSLFPNVKTHIKTIPLITVLVQEGSYGCYTPTKSP